MKVFEKVVYRIVLAFTLLSSSNAAEVTVLKPFQIEVLKGTASSTFVGKIKNKNLSGEYVTNVDKAIQFLPGSDDRSVVNIWYDVPDSVDSARVYQLNLNANMWTPNDDVNRVKVKIRNLRLGKWQTLQATKWWRKSTQWNKWRRNKYKNFQFFAKDYINTKDKVLLRVHSSNNNGGFDIDMIRLKLFEGDYAKIPIRASFTYDLPSEQISYTTDVVFIDYNVTATKIEELKAQNKLVLCYVSVGTAENYRDDYKEFPEIVLGNPLGDWPDEKWLDIRDERVFEIMKARIEVAQENGCQGIDPDNIDGYANESGFDPSLEVGDTMDYLKKIADEVHSRGMLIGMKNADGIVETAKNDNTTDEYKFINEYMDFSVTEECYRYTECDKYSIFTELKKPVFSIEYITEETDDYNSDTCDYFTDTLGFNILWSNYDLEEFYFCPIA